MTQPSSVQRGSLTKPFTKLQTPKFKPQSQSGEIVDVLFGTLLVVLDIPKPATLNL